MRRRRDLWIAAAALAVAAAAAAVFVVVGLSQRTGPAPLAAGEAIYRTGAFDCQPIPRTGSSGGMMSGGMMAVGCANCHGLDGHGRVTQTFTAPDITYANLTDPAGMKQPDGSRGPTYTDAALRKAVAQGIDPEGSTLAQPMPQWQLTEQEWTDLLAYLKTLR